MNEKRQHNRIELVTRRVWGQIPRINWWPWARETQLQISAGQYVRGTLMCKLFPHTHLHIACHIFQRTQKNSNKIVHKKVHHFTSQFYMLFHHQWISGPPVPMEVVEVCQNIRHLTTTENHFSRCTKRPKRPKTRADSKSSMDKHLSLQSACVQPSKLVRPSKIKGVLKGGHEPSKFLENQKGGFFNKQAIKVRVICF